MKSDNFRILIIKTAALGDVLRTTVILPGLHNKYPHSVIHWLTSDEARCIIDSNPLVERVLIPSQFMCLSDQHELVISLEEDEQLIDQLRSFDVKKITGLYRDEANGQIRYTRDSEVWFGMSLVRPQDEGGKLKADELKKQNRKTHPEILSEMLRIDCQKTRPMFYISEDEKACARQYLFNANIPVEGLVGLNPYAGQRWPSKEIPFDKSIELVNHLSAEFSILLLGGIDNLEKNRMIRAAASQPEKVFFVEKKTSIMELAAILFFCEMVITTDSLVVHLANALAKKVICVISHTSAEEIDLYGSGIKLITKTGCHSSYDPGCDQACMNTISIREYAEAIRALKE